MKNLNPTLRWIIFFPAIFIVYILMSYVWGQFMIHMIGSFYVNSFWDLDGDKCYKAVIYLIISPFIAAYFIGRLIDYLCPNPELGARILGGLYIFFAGYVYTKPREWGIGSVAALIYDIAILLMLVLIAFYHNPKDKSKSIPSISSTRNNHPVE